MYMYVYNTNEMISIFNSVTKTQMSMHITVLML